MTTSSPSPTSDDGDSATLAEAGNRSYRPGIKRCECGAIIGFCLCAVRAREADEAR